MSFMFEHADKDDDTPDPFLDQFIDEIDAVADQLNGKKVFLKNALNWDVLINDQSEMHYHYVGSTTTPPCVRDVQWNMMTELRQVSKKQLESFVNAINVEGGNNRPLQSSKGTDIMTEV